MRREGERSEEGNERGEVRYTVRLVKDRYDYMRYVWRGDKRHDGM